MFLVKGSAKWAGYSTGFVNVFYKNWVKVR